MTNTVTLSITFSFVSVTFDILAQRHSDHTWPYMTIHYTTLHVAYANVWRSFFGREFFFVNT
jgi:hypothetical protein